MQYVQHNHNVKPGFPYVLMVKAQPEIHELLERKGFHFQGPSDYYCHGLDSDLYDKEPIKRYLICVYEYGTWDGKSDDMYPMQPGMELVSYLNALPNV